MPELATAWVTLAVSGQHLRRDIQRVLNEADRGAKVTPKADTSRLAAQGSAAGKLFGERFSSAAKGALALGGVAVGVAGLAAQFKQVMSVGMDWTNNMNTLSAVTGATAEQLKQAGDAARALGNDISLPATSANDAASAMTELAKGGFTVQQAMDAAKGSLQLAAAAQISATDAATIQSQALQAFGLNANQAGKMSDTLANAANASSAEITDVAYALQAAGTVANQFGLSAEDTAAAIGLLANNGIKGSDAGTLLKSSLLALTDQGKPAQGAIEELGLTVYDTQGKFVGLHSLYGQLGEAAKRMTPEQYQAATAVLFGSDAMRIAGVAAKDGSASYDQMRVAIDRQGAAADVAAAKTQGLPGAWERVKNAIESLQLKAYDVLQGPVSRFLDQLSGALGKAEDTAVGAGPKIAAAWKQITGNQVVQSTWRDTVTILSSLGASAKELLPSLVQIGQSLAKASATLGVSSWKLLVAALTATAGALNAVMPLVQGIAGFMSNHTAVVTTAVGAWLLFRTVPALLGRVTGAVAPVTSAMSTLGRTVTGASGPLVPMRSRLTAIVGDFRNIGVAAQNNGQHLSTFSRLMTSVSNNSPTIRRMGDAFIGASTNVRGFASALRVGVQPAISGVRSAASGLIGALGGPFSAGLIAATTAFALWSAQVQKGEQRARDYAESLRNSVIAQREVYDELTKTRGNTSDSVFAGLTKQLEEFRNQVDAMKTGPDLLDWLGARGQRGIDSFDMQKRAEQWQAASDAMDKLNMSSQQLGIALAGDGSWEALQQNIQDTTGNSGDLIGKLGEIRKTFLDSQAASKNLTPAFVTVRDAIKTIADTASTAEDKTNAFKAALDALAGVQPTVQEATDRYNTTIRQTAQAATEIADATKGMGQQLIGTDGSVNTATENGHALFEALKNIKSATEGVAGAGGDLKSALAQNDQQLAALANKFGLTKAEIDKMAASYGYLPTQLETIYELRGADDATKQLGLVQSLLSTVPPNTPIQVDADSVNKAREELIKMGAKLEEVDVNGHKQLKITAPNEQVLRDIQAVIDKVKSIPSTYAIAPVVRTPDFVPAIPGETQRPRGGGRADGAIVPFGAIMPMADGGFRWIQKPQTAGLYAGRGAGTVFAEQETGGEAYIPLAPSKRPRSMAILMEVARLFGLNSNAEGSITVDQLKAFASGISGNPYAWGAGNGDTFATDCSGAQATIANVITGANGRFSTADEAQALLARGFQQGDPPAGIAAYWVGWKNGGPGGGHTAGTIVDPEGGNVNVEMGGRGGNGQYGGSAAGASEFPNRAWIALAGYGDDPSKTGGGATSARVMSAQASVRRTTAATAAAQKDLDEANAAIASAPDEKKRKAAEKKRDAAQRRLDSATDQQAVAEQRLAEVKDKEAAKTDKAASDGGAQGFGQSLVSGLLQGIGLDGSVFSNPLEWPNVKSALALVNWGGGLAKAWASADGQDSSGDGGMTGGALNGIGLPNVADFLKPIPPGSTTPIARPDEAHAGSGAAPGPTYDLRGAQLGVSPTEFTQKLDARQNSATRRQGFA